MMKHLLVFLFLAVFSAPVRGSFIGGGGGVSANACTSGQYASGISASGELTCATINASEVTNSVTAESPTFTGTVTIPAGTYHLTAPTLGFKIGSLVTGFTNDPSNSLNFHVNGNWLASLNYAASGSGRSLQTNVDNIRPDSAVPSSIGTSSRNYTDFWGRTFLFGGGSGSAGYAAAPGRRIWVGWGADVDGTSNHNSEPRVGMGWNLAGTYPNGYGDEVYFRGDDPGISLRREFFNVKHSSRVTTLSAPADSTADANAAQTLTLKGANKTAGTGNGGDTILDTSTSSGGTAGKILMKYQTTTKVTVDTTGMRVTSGKFGIDNAQTPSASNDTCTTGQIAWDTGYLYVCTTTDTWERVAVSTW